MTGYVPPQLHGLLGRSLDAVDDGGLRRLIGLPESQVFEAKREPYGNSEDARREMATDVAAFANRQGGLIVVGLAEDNSHVVSDLVPHPNEDMASEELRTSQIISSQVTPVPTFKVRRVEVDGGSVLLIAVSPSARRPHAIVVNNGLRFPLREGTHKRYLMESELADMYRSRFADAQTQTDLAHSRHQGFGCELLGDTGWLIVTLLPDHPGSFTLTRSSLEELRSSFWVARTRFPAWQTSEHLYPSPALRAIRWVDSYRGTIDQQCAVLSLDGGGSVAYGFVPGSLPFSPSDVVCVGDEDIVAGLINGLGALVSWAVDRCGCAGDGVVLVEMFSGYNKPMHLSQYREGHEMQLPDTRELKPRADESWPTTGVVEFTVSLDSLHRDPTDLIATVRRAAADIESAFGHIGPSQISADGVLRKPYFHSERRARVQQWADDSDVKTTESTALE